MYIYLPLLQAVLLYIILMHPLRTDNKTAMGFLDCFGGKVAKSCARKVIVMLGTTSELLWFYTMLSCFIHCCVMHYSLVLMYPTQKGKPCKIVVPANNFVYAMSAFSAAAGIAHVSSLVMTK